MKLISIGELIKQSWEVYKNNFKALMLIVAWLLPFTLLTSLFSLAPEEETYTDCVTSNCLPGAGVLAGAGLLSFLALAVYIVASITITLVLIQVIHKIYNKEEYNVKEIFKSSKGRIGGFIWVSAIVFVFVFLGFLALIIPGIVLAVWYSFSGQVFAIEKVEGYNALKRSKELVEGRWWDVLARLFVPALIFGLVIGIVGGIVGAIVSNIFFIDLLSGIISIVATPLFVAISVILYNNIKKIKEASAENQSPVAPPAPPTEQPVGPSA